MLAFRIRDLRLEFDPADLPVVEKLIDKLACPLCLQSLVAREDGSTLRCTRCDGVFLMHSGLPVLLVDDEHRRIKVDEIKGETDFNTKTVPADVHQSRNMFVDRNTDLFLGEAGVSLDGREVLAVGCSMAELLLCARYGAKSFCLDIVPTLALACREATAIAGLEAEWLCGDGECLPFLDEKFDVVIIRQALHHMLKYYSALAEFFRVLRVGGVLLIVDEPFCGLDPADSILNGPADHILYEGISVEKLRVSLGLPEFVGSPGGATSDIQALEKGRDYLESDGSDPEMMLADKYHSFSLLNCIAGLKMHTESFQLFWPLEIGWADHSGSVVRFCHGPSPHHDLPLLERLVIQGNVSIVARKVAKTVTYRDRQTVRAMPLDVVQSML